MMQIYKNLIDAINVAHSDYVEFSESIGIKGTTDPKQFMAIFLDAYGDYLNGGEKYGKDND